MDRKRARNWYWWLWLSPLLTVPTLLLLYGIVSTSMWALAGPSRSGSGAAIGNSIAERAAILAAVLGSAAWHLILLVPARDKEYAFVRWHGRQALLLAGVRTTIPVALVLLIGGDGALLSIPILLVVWFGGTLWGQPQAVRGKCSLMQRFGQKALSTLREAGEEIQSREQAAETLMEIVRLSHDPEERRRAIDELSRRGMVEAL
jgi:hypothetical protein